MHKLSDTDAVFVTLAAEIEGSPEKYTRDDLRKTVRMLLDVIERLTGGK